MRMSEVGDFLKRGGLAGIGVAKVEDAMKKGQRKAEASAEEAKNQAAQTAAAAAALEDEKKKKAAALLSQSSSGFASGASTARQFLTSL